MKVTSRVTSVAVLSLVLVGYASEASSMSPIFVTSSQMLHCQPSAVKVLGSTSRHTYVQGTPVKMTATIRNVSSKTCTVEIGGTSPSMTITNVKGVAVWNNCYSNDQPGACPMYLALRTLKPGAQFPTVRTWNQHIAGKLASSGTYSFSVSFAGLANKYAMKFTLIR